MFDKLLTCIDVQVDYFSLCILTAGWGLRLPGPPDVMLHFVLHGRGAVRVSGGRAWPLVPRSLAIVPKGAAHVLESAGQPKRYRRVDALPAGAKVPSEVIAGSSAHPDLVVACGLVRVRYGRFLGVFDQLRDVLTVDLSDCPQAQAAVEGIIAEKSQPASGSEALMGAMMTQCLVHV
ncbi:MAG: cupin domain-containing protein, partial [Steroidobacteraceae bacterium]